MQPNPSTSPISSPPPARSVLQDLNLLATLDVLIANEQATYERLLNELDKLRTDDWSAEGAELLRAGTHTARIIHALRLAKDIARNADPLREQFSRLRMGVGPDGELKAVSHG